MGIRIRSVVVAVLWTPTSRIFPTENRQTCIVFHFLLLLLCRENRKNEKMFTKNVSKSIAKPREQTTQNRGAPTYSTHLARYVMVALPFGGRTMNYLYIFLGNVQRRRSSKPIEILEQLFPEPTRENNVQSLFSAPAVENKRETVVSQLEHGQCRITFSGTRNASKRTDKNLIDKTPRFPF